MDSERPHKQAGKTAEARRKQLANLEIGKWKKGQVTNPKGKPKGHRNSITILKELLDKNTEHGSGLTVREAMLMKLIGKSLSDDKDALKAIQDILDRTEGKAIQTNVNVNSEKTHEEWLAEIAESEMTDDDSEPSNNS